MMNIQLELLKETEDNYFLSNGTIKNTIPKNNCEVIKIFWKDHEIFLLLRVPLKVLREKGFK